MTVGPNNIDTLFLSLTKQCNLTCAYCSADAGPDRTETLALERALNDVTGWLQSSAARAAQLVFTGGEPTLWGYDRLSRVCARVRQIADDRNISLQIGVQTNGTRVNDAFIEWCETWSVEPSVSLDGPPNISDQERGQGERTTQGLRRLIRAGLRPALIICVTRSVAKNIDSILDWLRSERLTKVRFNFLGGVPPGRDVEKLTEEEIFEVKRRILIHMLRNGQDGVRDWNTEKALAYAHHFWSTGEIRKSHCDNLRCGAGESIAAVNPSGRWSLCIERSMTGGLPEARSEDLAAVAGAYWDRFEDWSECGHCPARVICDQGCPAYHQMDKNLFLEQCGANKRYWALLSALCRPRESAPAERGVS